MSSPGRDYKQELYNSYKSERKDLNGSALTLSERYDKNILYIGAGALAVSLTFLEKIAPSPEGWLFLILSISWGCLVLSILAHLMALAYGQRAIRRQMEILDSDYNRFLRSENPEEEILENKEDNGNIYSVRTGYLSQFSLWFVVAGVAFLCVFSVVSLTTKSKNNYAQSKTTTASAASQTTNQGNQGIIYSAHERITTTTTASSEETVRVRETNKVANP